MNAKLIHPVVVEIANVDTANTQRSSVLDEPVGDVKYKRSFRILAQVKFSKAREVTEFANGFQLNSDGYLLVYGVVAPKINIGARIMKIENMDYELYVNSITPTSAYEESKFYRVTFVAKDRGGR
jgi:hypothetical protein